MTLKGKAIKLLTTIMKFAVKPATESEHSFLFESKGSYPSQFIFVMIGQRSVEKKARVKNSFCGGKRLYHPVRKADGSKTT